jgi:hypothetical protein
MSDHGQIRVEWLDGKSELYFGRVRILDTGGGILEIFERSSISGHETVKASIPLAAVRKWAPL